MIDQKIVPIGLQCFTGDHTLIEVLGAAGFDYVWLDSEHSPVNPRALEDTIRTCAAADLTALVRIPEPTDSTAARRALEAGAEGVIVPMVRSASDVQTIIDALTFPPTGTRGLCPAMRAPGYSVTAFNDYMRVSDANLLVIPMIETVDAVADIEEICALEHVGMLVFAAGELAFAMGEATNMHSSAKVHDAHRKVSAAAARHGVALIGGPILNPSQQTCAAALADGISVLCVGIDVLAFRQVCETTVAAATAAINAHDTFHRDPPPPSGFPSTY